MKRKKSMQCYAASCWCDFGDLRQSESCREVNNYECHILIVSMFMK